MDWMRFKLNIEKVLLFPNGGPDEPTIPGPTVSLSQRLYTDDDSPESDPPLDPTSFNDATAIYVDPNTGNDANTGTQANPVQTIRRAAELLDNGSGRETIILAEGTYQERAVLRQLSDMTDLETSTSYPMGNGDWGHVIAADGAIPVWVAPEQYTIEIVDSVFAAGFNVHTPYDGDHMKVMNAAPFDPRRAYVMGNSNQVVDWGGGAVIFNTFAWVPRITEFNGVLNYFNTYQDDQTSTSISEAAIGKRCQFNHYNKQMMFIRGCAKLDTFADAVVTHVGNGNWRISMTRSDGDFDGTALTAQQIADIQIPDSLRLPNTEVWPIYRNYIDSSQIGGDYRKRWSSQPLDICRCDSYENRMLAVSFDWLQADRPSNFMYDAYITVWQWGTQIHPVDGHQYDGWGVRYTHPALRFGLLGAEDIAAGNNDYRILFNKNDIMTSRLVHANGNVYFFFVDSIAFYMRHIDGVEKRAPFLVSTNSGDFDEWEPFDDDGIYPNDIVYHNGLWYMACTDGNVYSSENGIDSWLPTYNRPGFIPYRFCVLNNVLFTSWHGDDPSTDGGIAWSFDGVTFNGKFGITGQNGGILWEQTGRLFIGRHDMQDNATYPVWQVVQDPLLVIEGDATLQDMHIENIDMQSDGRGGCNIEQGSQ